MGISPEDRPDRCRRGSGEGKRGRNGGQMALLTETDIQAIGRLTPRESYDRAFRMRTAFQQSVLHRELPKKQWTTTEQVSFLPQSGLKK